jgi:hypothetical protein
MLAVFWSPLNFSFAKILPTRIHFDSQYSCSNILSEIMQNQPLETPEGRRRTMVVHFDNATLRAAKCMIGHLRANRLARAPHPAFSPDLAPSYFYLFGKLEMALMDTAITDDDKLLQSVMEVFNGIPREEFEPVFEKSLLRFDRCIQQNGEYPE